LQICETFEWTFLHDWDKDLLSRKAERYSKMWKLFSFRMISVSDPKRESIDLKQEIKSSHSKLTCSSDWLGKLISKGSRIDENASMLYLRVRQAEILNI
jgi:hypothetical protein